MFLERNEKKMRTNVLFVAVAVAWIIFNSKMNKIIKMNAIKLNAGNE